MMRHVFWLLLGYSCLSSGVAQDILATHKWEDFDTEAGEIYPYAHLSQTIGADYLEHEPTLRLHDGQLALLWKPEKINSRLRRISRYNLLLEEAWTVSWELDRNEYILGMVQQQDTLVVITADYEFLAQQHIIRARRWSLAEGETLSPALLQVVKGRQYEDIFFQRTPDGRSFGLYYLGHQSDRRRVVVNYSYIDPQQQLGYVAYKVRHIFFTSYSQQLDLLRADTLTVPDRRHALLGCHFDDAGNFFAYLFRNKGKLKVFFSPAQGGEDQMLSYDPELRDPYEFREGYYSHLPPAIGEPGHLWWAFADRKKRGRDRGIKGYQVVLFDFNQHQVDLRRKLPITSTLLVAAEKQREAYSLRPMRRFDEYQIMDIFELPDSSSWLLTQKYVYSSFTAASLGYSRHERVEERAEEMILFQFDAQGDIRQAVVVPSVQYARNAYDQVGMYYEAFLDTAQQRMHLLTREASGDNMRGPDRLYYRQVNLATGRVSRRILLFEGDRRNQYWVRGYTTWLTPAIATFLIIDGTNGKPLLVSANLEAEPPADEETPSAERQ